MPFPEREHFDAATVDLISGAFSVADDVWFTEDAAGRDQFNPVYIAVVGTDVDASIEAETAFCDHLQSEHPDFHAMSRCARPPSDCAVGVCYFADLAGSTAASISSMRSVEGFHLMILTADLADYGAARLIGSNAPRRAGTLWYRPPEQALPPARATE